MLPTYHLQRRTALRKKCYKKFKQIITIELSEIRSRFSIYTQIVEKQVKEERANKCSWGGYENLTVVSNFKKELDKEIDAFLNKMSLTFEKLDRKLTAKQVKEITDITIRCFQTIIKQFREKLPDIIGDVNLTIDTHFNLMPNNISQKINNYIELMNFTKAYRYDKYFFWTIFANVIALISLVATIIFSLFT